MNLKRIFLKIDDRDFLLNYNNNIYSNYTKNEIVESGENIYIKILENRDSFEERDLIKGEFRNFGFESRILHQYKLLGKKSKILLGTKFYKANIF